jgi:hypothetical protein
MAKKELSKSKDDFDRSFQQVGHFFSSWALLELRMNSAITKILNLEDRAGYIILANVQVRDKIHILRTAFSIWDESDPNSALATKTMNRIARMAGRRNILAHTMFYPMTDGSIEIAKVEAKGELNFPKIYWRPSDFESFQNSMLCARNSLDQLTKSAVNRTAIIRALMRRPTSEPMSLLQQLVLGDYQAPQAPAPLGSLLGMPIEKTEAQTDPEPQPKEGEAK